MMPLCYVGIYRNSKESLDDVGDALDKCGQLQTWTLGQSTQAAGIYTYLLYFEQLVAADAKDQRLMKQIFETEEEIFFEVDSGGMPAAWITANYPVNRTGPMP